MAFTGDTDNARVRVRLRFFILLLFFFFFFLSLFADVKQGRILPWLPGVLFGGLSIGGSLLILFLPETLNRPLPQTIEDIENWSKKAKDKSATQQHEIAAVQVNDAVMDGNAALVNSI